MQPHIRFSTRLLSLSLLLLMVSSCKKMDWRDAHIGSYNMSHFYEFPNFNLSTGQVYGYTKDVDSIFATANVQILKNDYADKYTVKIEGKYVMDVDKDGYSTLPTGHMSFVKDTLHLSFDNLNDTIRFGRYTFIGVKN